MSRFFLILSVTIVIGCDKGGELGSDRLQSVSWVINQSIARTFTSGTNSGNFSVPGGNSFSSVTGSFSFDLSPRSDVCEGEKKQVIFNPRSITNFDWIWCGTGTFTGPIAGGPFFYMTTWREYGEFLEVISFAFPGTRPKTGNYDLELPLVIQADYTVFIRLSETLFHDPTNYRAVDGKVAVESTPTSFRLTSSNLLFANSSNSIRLGVDLRCCN